ncbi:MAG: M28 family metallopeptidase [Bacteroidetes bacterium]|nr:M28 family metallopeptidase [Bacteroidota bacterium]
MRNLFISCTLCFFLQNIFAQTIIQKDHAIEKMVGEVNADSLKSYINTLVRFGTRQTLSTTNDPKKGIGAAREWIISKFKNFAANSNGRMTVELDKWILPADGKRVDVNADMGNAMAILHGTDTADKRIFIISGHMDSRVTDVMNRTSDAPGANDDGSGTSAVIECARVMSTYSFPATIIFVAVCGEEQGLLGSDHLADKAQKNNWDVEAMLNNDIVGSNNSSETNIIDNTRIRVFSEGLPFFELEKKAAAIRQLGMENDGASRQLARYVKETGERYVANLDVVMIYRNDRFLRGGDHSPFIQRGFTAVRLTEMNENYEHQHQDLRTEKNIKYGDLPEFMDFEYLRKNTALNLCNLANLAKSPSKPEDVKIDVKNLTNSTYLYWKEPKNTKPKGYFVLMRETTAAQWQKKFFTDKTEMRLPYSKDNYFFSVQSVSTDGNESLPVVPSVGR